MDYMYVVDAAVCINIAPELKKNDFPKVNSKLVQIFSDFFPA